MKVILNEIRLVGSTYLIFSLHVFELSLVLLSILYLFLKPAAKARDLVNTCILLTFFICNPLFANNMISFIYGGAAGIYWQIFYLLPFAIVVPYAAICIGDRQKKKKGHILVFLLVFVLLQLNTRLDYTWQNLDFSLNISKIDPEVRQIGDTLTGIDAYAMAPEHVASQLREYNLAARVYYNKPYAYDASDLKTLTEMAKEYECNVIIMEKDEDDRNRIQAAGYTYLTETEHYVLYVYLS